MPNLEYYILENEEKAIGRCDLCEIGIYPDDNIYDYDNGDTVCEDCYIDYNRKFRKSARTVFDC